MFGILFGVLSSGTFLMIFMYHLSNYAHQMLRHVKWTYLKRSVFVSVVLVIVIALVVAAVVSNLLFTFTPHFQGFSNSTVAGMLWVFLGYFGLNMILVSMKMWADATSSVEEGSNEDAKSEADTEDGEGRFRSNSQHSSVIKDKGRHSAATLKSLPSFTP